MLASKADLVLFGGVPRDFSSPFPSLDAQLSAKFKSFAGQASGQLAALQAKAWSDALRMSLREVATSTITGGIRTDWWSKIVWESDVKGVGGIPILDGLFADIGFSSTASKIGAISKDLGADLRKRGFNKALNVISSNGGVYGQIVVAAVRVAQFFMRYAMRDRKVQLLTVPWQEYSRGTEDDLINIFLMPMMESADWTSLFAPGLDSSRGFQTGESEKGEHTRVYGVFERMQHDGSAGTPDYTGDYGFLPGTQRMAEVMQIAGLGQLGQQRVDEVTNVGDFYPSTAQFATAAWQFVMKAGSADMFKVRPTALESRWRSYWGAFFEDGFREIARLRAAGGSQQNEISSLFTAKALAPWINWIDKKGRTDLGLDPVYIASAGNLDAFINADMFKPGGGINSSTTYSSAFDPIIKPALRKLKVAQTRSLARTPVCALVRHQAVGNLPAFAAFDNSQHGQQLAKLCHDAREALLVNNLRYYVNTNDVRAVDPPYAARLAASKALAPPFGLKADQPPRLFDAVPAIPKADIPKGGVPFSSARYVGPSRGGGGVALALAAAAALVIAGRGR